MIRICLFGITLLCFVFSFIAVLIIIGTYEPYHDPKLTKDQDQEMMESMDSMNHQATKRASILSQEIRIGIPYEMEGRIVAEIYAKALEDKNKPVSRVYLNEGESPYDAFLDNRIDLYPEYILPAYYRLRRAGVVGDVYNEVENYFLKDSYLYSAVKNYVIDQAGIDLLIPAPFNAGKGMVMTRVMSRRYGICTISALCKEAQYIHYVKDKNTNNLNKTTKNSTNQLTEIYGNFQFRSEEVFPTDICYFVMKTQFGDVMEMSQTSPVIAKEQFIRLVDDKVAYLSNQVSPAIRHELCQIDPELKAILEDAMGGLTTSVITRLKADIEYENASYTSVVNDYFDSSY